MHGKATTVDEYLAGLPEDRRAAIQAVRKVILANLDDDFEEGMQYGMIGYYVPHRVYPAGCHGKPEEPLPFMSLASQKNYMTLHGMCLYEGGELHAWFADAWKKAGKKLDMGQCCVRFKALDDVALDVIGEIARRVRAQKYVKQYEALVDGRGATAKAKLAKKGGAEKTRKAARA